MQIFNSARDEIFSLMQRDSNPRFLKSKAFALLSKSSVLRRNSVLLGERPLSGDFGHDDDE